jgi:cellulose synthase/poly-beta-1,6-N-acetylglucosamine synthase-like glycosyltransferase
MQRFGAKEIYTAPCYSPQEINLFANAINKMHQNRATMVQMGKDAAQYVSEFRSLKYQEKLFLNFIEMKKSEGERRKVNVKGKYNLPQRNESEEKELPKVSILMPTRDGNEEWINQAIESIANQKYAGELELVVVNHDCRMSMIGKLEKIISKLREKMVVQCIVIDDDTVSFSEALDLGVEKCTGHIIIRMDHDDIAEPELVSKLVVFMMKNPDIAVCGVQIKFFAGKEIVTHHPAIITKQLAASMANWWFVNHPGVAIRKSELLKIGGYGHTKQGYAEDYALWCKFLKAGYVIANLPDVLVNYRCYKKDRERPKDYIESLEKEKADLRK